MAELNEKQIALLRGRNWGSLATLRADDTPHVTTVWVDFDGECPIVNSAYGRAKVRHLDRDPRVGLLVLDHENPQRAYVSITGRAELVDDGALENIHALAKKYLDLDEYPWLQEGERRVIIRIVPDRVNGFGDAA